MADIEDAPLTTESLAALDLTCPSCGNNDWWLLDTGSYDRDWQLSDDRTTLVSRDFEETTTETNWYCNHCGLGKVGVALLADLHMTAEQLERWEEIADFLANQLDHLEWDFDEDRDITAPLDQNQGGVSQGSTAEETP